MQRYKVKVLSYCKMGDIICLDLHTDVLEWWKIISSPSARGGWLLVQLRSVAWGDVITVRNDRAVYVKC